MHTQKTSTLYCKKYSIITLKNNVLKNSPYHFLGQYDLTLNILDFQYRALFQGQILLNQKRSNLPVLFLVLTFSL